MASIGVIAAATAPPRSVTPVDLTRPPASQPASQISVRDTTAKGGEWSLSVERASPEAGVPWRLIALPLPPLAERLATMDSFAVSAAVESVPVIEVPEQLWPQWFDADMSDVVGIHYHECLMDGPARVLVSVHKVPADGADGKPPAEYRGKPGTRLEATLLTPLAIHLDQVIVVRGEGIGAARGATKPPRPAEEPGKPRIGRKSRDQQGGTAGRTAHERGHAEISLQALLQTVAGPNTWNQSECIGRRSTLTWFWESRKIRRAWDGFRGPAGKLYTQRTTLYLAPPTRWSILLPVPPDEVTQRQIEQFNDWAVLPAARFPALDAEAQRAFHATHGEFEGCD